MSAIEAYALAGAFASGVLAVLHFLVWRRLRADWSGMFMVAYTLLCLIYSFDAHLQPNGSRPNLLATMLGVPAMLLITLGFVRYVSVPRRAMRHLDLACIAVACIHLLAVATGAIDRLLNFSFYACFLLLQAALALWALRREPGHGHALLFAALMLYPAVVLMGWQGWFAPALMRYAVSVPLIVSGAAVLTTGLLRAQRRSEDELQRRRAAEAELQALNATLEQRVTQRTAELREVVEGLESFNRSVSHDLRGPLGGIAGVSHLALTALARDDRATVERMLTAIEAQARSSTQLVNDLLALARVNDTELSPKTIDLDGFVRETLAQMHLTQPDAPPLPVDVHALPTVEADPGLLRQVYVNLLGNAIKFSRDAHPPHVEVGAYREGGEEVLYVRDNGVGFDDTKASQLFEPFQRLHGQSFAGHGVGLSIVKRIVERHGGRLWAQAAPNAGATFYFSLPANR